MTSADSTYACTLMSQSSSARLRAVVSGSLQIRERLGRGEIAHGDRLREMGVMHRSAVLTLSNNREVILMLVNIMLLVLGCLMDLAPLLLICTPILLPVVSTFGVDPVHFGMIMLLNLGIGLLTPPVGATLFVGCVVGKVSMQEVMRGTWPFYGVMFAVLMLVTYIPAISLWLPRILGL